MRQSRKTTRSRRPCRIPARSRRQSANETSARNASASSAPVKRQRTTSPRRASKRTARSFAQSRSVTTTSTRSPRPTTAAAASSATSGGAGLNGGLDTLLRRCGEHGRERVGEERVLVRGADRDPQSARGAEGGHRPHDRTLAQQRLEERLCVLPDLDEEEVGDRGARRLQPMVAQRPLQRRTPLGRETPTLRQLGLRVHARERRDLRLRVDVERAPRLADRLDHIGGPDAVADAQTCEPVDLGEGAEDEHTVPAEQELRDALRVVGPLDVLEVRLVEHGEHVPGDTCEVRVQLLTRRHRPRRVVRRRDVDELRLPPDRIEQRVEIVVVVDERHLARYGAQLHRVEHVADEGGPGGDDLVAGIERGDGEMADDRIGTCSRDDVCGLDPVACGERVAEVEGAAVGVAVEGTGAPLERLDRGRQRSPRPLVRRELDDPVEPELALHLFLGLPGLVRTEAVERGAEQAHPQAAYEPAGGGSSSSELLRRLNQSRPPRAATIVAIAPLFGRFEPSTVPGSASFAFFLSTRLAITHVSQPVNAFRLLKMPIGTGPYQPALRDRAGSEATLQASARSESARRIPSMRRKSKPPPLRQGGGSGRKAGPAGGTAPMWGGGA